MLALEDVLERRTAREAFWALFRALLRKVVVTPLPERGDSEVRVVTELAALASEGGRDRIDNGGCGDRI